MHVIHIKTIRWEHQIISLSRTIIITVERHSPHSAFQFLIERNSHAKNLIGSLLTSSRCCGPLLHSLSLSLSLCRTLSFACSPSHFASSTTSISLLRISSIRILGYSNCIGYYSSERLPLAAVMLISKKTRP